MSGQAVSLRFNIRTACAFLRETTREVESDRKQVKEVSGTIFGSGKVTHKVVMTVHRLVC